MGTPSRNAGECERKTNDKQAGEIKEDNTNRKF